MSFANHRCTRVHRHYHKSSHLQLNRILFDTSEIDEGNPSSEKESLATVTLAKDDYRTIHVANILGLQNGDTLRAGSVRSPNDVDNELAGLVTDDATIQWLPEGKIKKAQPTKNGEPPGSLQISIPYPPSTILYNTTQTTTQDIPPVSLLLALPRPLQLTRILPMISQLGVDQLVLSNAKKVPKDYFGSHIFRKPEVLRGMLVEGLAISGDVQLPNVTVTKRLKIFIEDELDALFPREEYARVIAHPRRKGDIDERVELRMSDIRFPTSNGPKRILVAVG